MRLSELSEKIAPSVHEPVVDRKKLFAELHDLKEKSWIDFAATENAEGGHVWLTGDGRDIAEQIKKSQKSNQALSQQISQKKELSSISIISPSTGPLETIEQDLLITRKDVVTRIRQNLQAEHKHFILLHGQPMVGKTRILESLKTTLADDFVPLKVDFQGRENLASLNDFLFDLAERLAEEFEDWAESHDVNILSKPDGQAYQRNPQRTFAKFWHGLCSRTGGRHPLLLFDEIEFLLDVLDGIDPEILIFLQRFMSNPNNGYFVITGSERIRYCNHAKFSELIARAEPMLVGYHDRDTVASIFSAMEDHFPCEEKAKESFVALCDGNPRIIREFIETIKYMKSGLEGSHIKYGDVEQIVREFIKKYLCYFWALWQRLGDEEAKVVWLVSRARSGVSIEEKYLIAYSIHELQQTAERVHVVADQGTLERGVADLDTREWVERVDMHKGLFRFKLGVIPEWLYAYSIRLDETRSL